MLVVGGEVNEYPQIARTLICAIHRLGSLLAGESPCRVNIYVPQLHEFTNLET